MPVVNFPEKSLDPLVGPFTEYRVVVEGRCIPNLTGRREGDHTWLIVDGRFGAPVPNDSANQVAWLLGNAMAVAGGYSSLNAESKDMPFAPKMMRISPEET